MQHLRRPTPMLAATLLALLSTTALAQGVYRIVGPDGRVTFSDQPPPSSAPATATGSASASGGTSSGTTALPYALRQVTGRYPVTLYSGDSCAPCNSGRNLLNARGVPYTEKTINTAHDADALKRLSGETSLPVLTIGSQQIKGYSEQEWTSYLDAAGYPKQSQLPSSYRRPAPSPLVVAAPAAPATNAAPATAPTAPRATTSRQRPASGEETPAEVPVTPAPANPAGIRF